MLSPNSLAAKYTVTFRHTCDKILLCKRTAGNIVIDGIAASSYSTMLGSEATMHAFTGVGRLLYRLAPGLLRYVHARRIAEPISFAIGNAMVQVRWYYFKPWFGAMSWWQITQASTFFAALPTENFLPGPNMHVHLAGPPPDVASNCPLGSDAPHRWPRRRQQRLPLCPWHLTGIL